MLYVDKNDFFIILRLRVLFLFYLFYIIISLQLYFYGHIFQICIYL